MKPNPKAILPVILLLALTAYGVYYVLTHYAGGAGAGRFGDDRSH